MIVLLLSGEYCPNGKASRLMSRQMEMLNVFMGVCPIPRGNERDWADDVV